MVSECDCRKWRKIVIDTGKPEQNLLRLFMVRICMRKICYSERNISTRIRTKILIC